MRRGTLLLLVLLVATLGVMVVQRNKDREGASQPEVAVFAGFDARQVTRVDVQNLERATRVTLESDGGGRWALTHPVAYPASGGMLSTLLQGVHDLVGYPVDEPAGGLSALGLDPPRAVLSFRSGDRETRLEIGGDEVGAARIYARADGALFRIRPTLYNAVQVPLEDYRERRATTIESRDVITFRRSGWIVHEPGQGEIDLTLDAILEPEHGWVLQEPRSAMDPVVFGFLVRAAAELRVTGFTADEPGDLSPWGLDNPRLTVELDDAHGQSVTLHFSCAEVGQMDVETPERWYACRAGYPFVWSVEHRVVGLLSAPEDELRDALFVRTQREEIVRAQIDEVILTRNAGTGAWRVSSPGLPGAGADGAPADLDAVGDVLSRLEFARVDTWLTSASDEADPAGDAEPAGEVFVTLRDGRRLGGALFRDPDPATGTARVLFRRYGDEVVGVASADAVALVELEPHELRARHVPTSEEIHLGGMTVRRGDQEARFVRDPNTGRWRREGALEDAGAEFFVPLESLLALEARAWLDEAEELDDAAALLHVEFHAAAGVAEGALVTPSLVLGGGPGRAVCRTPDGAVFEVAPALLDGLVGLLQ